MASFPVKIRQKSSLKERRVVLEMDAERLEKLAEAFGWYSSDFLASIDRAEKDIKAKRVRKIRSFRDLRK